MTQKTLADAIGSTSAAVSAWLAESSKGKSPPKFPNAEHLFKMADVLQVSLDRLVGRRVLGTEILEQARDQSRQQADALDQILPAQGDHERDFSPDKTSHSRAKGKRKQKKKRQ